MFLLALATTDSVPTESRAYPLHRDVIQRPASRPRRYRSAPSESPQQGRSAPTPCRTDGRKCLRKPAATAPPFGDLNDRVASLDHQDTHKRGAGHTAASPALPSTNDAGGNDRNRLSPDGPPSAVEMIGAAAGRSSSSCSAASSWRTTGSSGTTRVLPVFDASTTSLPTASVAPRRGERLLRAQTDVRQQRH